MELRKDRKIQSFEDLEVYQRARELRRKVYLLVRDLPKNEMYGLADQIKRAVLSITSNIAEGYGRFHYKENIQFCRQARGSLNELIDQLGACFDLGYISSDRLSELREDVQCVNRLLNGYIAATQRLLDKEKSKLETGNRFRS